MRNKLFVSNLSPSLTEADVLEMFAAFKPTIVKIDREKNSAVLHLTGDVMEDVVERLNGLRVEGRPIQVQLSVLIEPRAERGSAEDDLRPQPILDGKPATKGANRTSAVANPFGGAIRQDLAPNA